MGEIDVTGSGGKTRFRDFVATESPATPNLPLVHNTDMYRFLNALEEGQLTPTPCNVFTGESLIYFFYGRPSFRPNAEEPPTGLHHYFPVCLIMRPDTVIPIKRIFPFDSGAFANHMYDTYLHHDMSLADFGLDPHPSTPGRVVQMFFGEAPSYLLANAKSGLALPPEQLEASSYTALISAQDANAIDSRGSGIEVQTDQAVELQDQVAAIVLPNTFLDGGGTLEKLSELGVDAIPYRPISRSRPSEYFSEITNLCYNYYIASKLLPEGSL